MFSIDLSKSVPRWVKYPENPKENEPQVEFLIRAYPASKTKAKLLKSQGEKLPYVIIDKKEEREAFVYCLMDAKNLWNTCTKKEIKIDDDTKKAIFDYHQDTGIPDFVLREAGAFRKEIEDEKKISLNGQNGALESIE